MDPSTLDTSIVTVLDTTNGARVPATVSYDEANRKMTIDPSTKLARRTKYEATIRGGTNSVKDVTDEALAAAKVWSFKTRRR
jgi:hypothetical protein